MVKSYECLLQCAALKDSSVAKTIAEHSELPHKLVLGYLVYMFVCACVFLSIHISGFLMTWTKLPQVKLWLSQCFLTALTIKSVTLVC